MMHAQVSHKTLVSFPGESQTVDLIKRSLEIHVLGEGEVYVNARRVSKKVLDPAGVQMRHYYHSTRP